MKLTSSMLLATLERERILAIARAGTPDEAIKRVVSLVGSGLAVVEISLSTPGWDSALRLVAEDPALDEALLGVGTVTTVEQLKHAVDAGAVFVVTPVIEESVIRSARDMGIPIIPGAATPTEVFRGLEAGATAIKLFPASLWTPTAFRDLRQVFVDVAFVPTGGVAAEDAPHWIDAGALAVGLGSALAADSLNLAAFKARLQRGKIV